jgi:hypothetical protein
MSVKRVRKGGGPGESLLQDNLNTGHNIARGTKAKKRKGIKIAFKGGL